MESIECKICFELFDDEDEELTPRILTTCGHTVCEGCADQLLNKGNTITCPFDRKLTKVANSSVKELNKNYTVLEIFQESKKTSEECEKVIGACNENSEHDAIFYCEQCDVDFCKKCFVKIHSSKTLSGHRKIPVSEKPMKLPKCPKHPYNTAEFLCKEPDCEKSTKLMCHTCLLGNEHKDHKYKFLMDQFLENEKILKDQLETIHILLPHLEAYISTAIDCVKSFEKTGPTFEKLSENISKEFDTKKEEALKRLETLAKHRKIHAEQVQETLEVHLIDTNCFQKKLQLKLQTKNEIQELNESDPFVDGLRDFLIRYGERTLKPLEDFKFKFLDLLVLDIEEP